MKIRTLTKNMGLSKWQIFKAYVARLIRNIFRH